MDKSASVRAKEFMDRVSSYDSERKDRVDDLEFFMGKQWPDELKALREGDPNGARPCLTINKIPLHVHQITNDVRQNPPGIKVHPVDDNADVKTAEVLNGIIRHIQYQSDADVAISTAADHQAISGLGYWQITTKVIDPATNKQEIIWEAIDNPATVYYDIECKCPYGTDARRVLIVDEMPIDEFKSKWPDANTTPFDGETTNNWFGDGTITVGILWEREEVSSNYLQTAAGWLPEDEYWAQVEASGEKTPILATESRKSQQVKWSRVTANDTLEDGEWAGSYIPVVRVPGEVINVDGKRIFRGIVRNAKDPQRMYNYWVSAETELIALQPKAPFIGAAGVFDGFEDRWAQANTSNLPYLEFNSLDVNGNPAAAPQRQPFSGSPNGVINAKMGAADDIKATTGQYDASLGMRSNETSGKAIMARQREGDTGTYHFVDNMAKAIRLTGRIIIDLIPKIYDTARVVRIVGEDDSVDVASIDPNQTEPVRKVRTIDGIKTIYNPSVGKYDVTVSVGPSYTTKRTEAFEAMTQIVQANPQLFGVIGDLIVKNMDWPGADVMAKRLNAMLPPQIQQMEGAEEVEIPPQIQAMAAQIQQTQQQLQIAGQAMAQKEQELTKMQTEVESSIKELQAEKKVMDANVRTAKAELRLMEQQAMAGNPDDTAAVQALMRYTESLEAANHELSAKLDRLVGIIAQSVDDGPEEMMEQQPPEGGFFTPENREME